MMEVFLLCVFVCCRKLVSATCPSQTPTQVGSICWPCLQPAGWFIAVMKEMGS